MCKLVLGCPPLFFIGERGEPGNKAGSNTTCCYLQRVSAVRSYITNWDLLNSVTCMHRMHACDHCNHNHMYAYIMIVNT